MDIDAAKKALAKEHPEYVLTDEDGTKHFNMRQLMIDRGHIKG